MPSVSKHGAIVGAFSLSLTARRETVDPLEFLARVLTQIPDKRQVMRRYCWWYANRPRGARRKRAAESAGAASPVLMAEPVPLLFRAARLRSAELLRRIYEVDQLRCPQCRVEMRIVALLTEPAVIDRILTHLWTRQTRTPPGKDVASHSDGPLTSMPPLRAVVLGYPDRIVEVKPRVRPLEHRLRLLEQSALHERPEKRAVEGFGQPRGVMLVSCVGQVTNVPLGRKHHR